MAPATFYDPEADSEKIVPLPDAPVEPVPGFPGLSLQPPLTRRGTGPGLVVVVPDGTGGGGRKEKYDPDPRMKWAEEGYVVAEVRAPPGTGPVPDVWRTWLSKAVEVALAHASCDDQRLSIVVYEPSVVTVVLSSLAHLSAVVSAIVYVSDEPESFPDVPLLVHIVPRSESQSEEAQSRNFPSNNKIYTYATVASPYFVLPSHSNAYNYTQAALAHTRSLEFFKRGKNNINAPLFDLEAIWEEHTYFEFVDRSVAKTMGTMVAEPYVNHIPTLTGGIGRKALSEFYRDHFIFSNPGDTELQLVSRTIGVDRIVDEFIFALTHTTTVDWLLPGVPPSGKLLRIPFSCVVCVRGDRLYHEHIAWDQASALRQAGLIPDSLPYQGRLLKLPVAGSEASDKLADKDSQPSNELIPPREQFSWV